MLDSHRSKIQSIDWSDCYNIVHKKELTLKLTLQVLSDLFCFWDKVSFVQASFKLLFHPRNLKTFLITLFLPGLQVWSQWSWLCCSGGESEQTHGIHARQLICQLSQPSLLLLQTVTENSDSARSFKNTKLKNYSDVKFIFITF